MIENDDLDNLYLMFRGRVEPVKEWSIGFCNIKNKTYFKREEVK